MHECTNANTNPIQGPSQIQSQLAQVEALYQVLLTGELPTIKEAISQYQNDNNRLLSTCDLLGRIINSRELVITSRQYYWKRGDTTKSGVVCEFKLLRAQKVLLLSTEPDFSPIVLEQKPGTAGTRSSDSPVLLMKQISKIASLPTSFALPPTTCNVY
jgi:hypothetical protein